MIKVGITGQRGFIGTHLTNYLRFVYKDYFIVNDFYDEYFDDDTKLVNFIKNCDIIVHLAGVNRHAEPEYIYSKNIELTHKLIDAISKANSKPHIIFSSSTQENLNNVYGKAKRECRLKLLDFASKNNLKFSGLIIPNVFGPFGKPFYNSVIATFCYQLINEQKPRIEIDAQLKLIYVGDLIEFIINVIKNQKEGIVDEISVPYSFSAKVSELLEKLKHFYEVYYKQGVIPKFDFTYEIDLFNTFRSYINLEEYFPREYKIKADDRGVFVELIKLNTGGQISFSTTRPGIVRGNHFHTRKIERFAVIKGRAKIQLRRIGTEKVYEFELSGEKPSYVDMPVWYTHNLLNIGNEELVTIFWINEFYDQKNPDTYFEKV